MSYKIAIVHDYITQIGGAERIVLDICEAFPDAPLFTSIYSPKETYEAFTKKDIRVTYLQGLYGLFRNHRVLLPFYPSAFKAIDLSGFDVILSSSSAFAKGVRKPKGSIHISYCYNPARFIWMKDIYLGQEKSVFLKKMYLNMFLNKLKRWDVESAKNVDYFISISSVVKERIKKIYGRESAVIYPPVDCEKFVASGKNDGYYLIVSRLAWYKRIDIAIKAFNALGLKLKIVGTGPQYSVLKKMASRNIDFVGAIEGEALKEVYGNCIAFIFPQEEDFGLTPLEANASGKPVVAFAKGGALETLKPYDEKTQSGTAIFFYNQTPEDLITAVRKLNEAKFDPQRLRENALRFDKSVFISNMKNEVEKLSRTRMQ